MTNEQQAQRPENERDRTEPAETGHEPGDRTGDDSGSGAGTETGEEEEAAAEAAEIDRLETEVADLKDKLMRAVAETENVRRRAERDRTDTANYAVTGFARDLLSVADNLARALEAAEKDEVVNQGLLTGVEATMRELMKAFEKHGITRVEAVGKPLDPHVHQAMLEVDAPEGTEAGTIVAELQPGYTIKDRLLRPAMVSVAK